MEKRHKLNVMEMKCLWNMCGLTILDGCRNEKVGQIVSERKKKALQSGTSSFEVVRICGASECRAVE